MKIFFGKISQTFSEQHEYNFYAAGEKGSPWYNGLEINDYVFPIFGGRITKLWKVIKYSDTPIKNKKFDDKSVLFEVVKEFSQPFQLATQVCNYRYFELNLEMLNKSTKSTSTEQKGFYEISLLENCPECIFLIKSDTHSC